MFDVVLGCILPSVSSRNLETLVLNQARQQNAESRVFLLDAPGGTGNTFETRAIHDILRLREKKVIAVTTSAVAAVLLDEGRTAHSTFKIPIPITAKSTCSISPSLRREHASISARSQLAQDFVDTDFIIWDEILMCHRHCVEAVDGSLWDMTRRNLPF